MAKSNITSGLEPTPVLNHQILVNLFQFQRLTGSGIWPKRLGRLKIILPLENEKMVHMASL